MEDVVLALVILDVLALVAAVYLHVQSIEFHIITIIAILPVIPHVEVDPALDHLLELLQLEAKI